MDLLGTILLFLGMGLGLLIIPFGLPGVAVILVCALIYALATDFKAAISMNLFILLCVLTGIGETADNWLMALGAKRYGASRGAIWLSFLGGLLGGLLGGPLLALFMGFLGPFVGAFLGAFAAVFLYEYSKQKTAGQALRAGWGTVLGRMAGIVVKMIIGIAMVVAISFAVLF
jgi:uncharacterized protein